MTNAKGTPPHAHAPAFRDTDWDADFQEKSGAGSGDRTAERFDDEARDAGLAARRRVIRNRGREPTEPRLS